jgi:hypothetical protein
MLLNGDFGRLFPMHDDNILLRRILRESQRFEASVAGKPFLPSNELLEALYNELFVSHCTDIDELMGCDAHHLCWMLVANSEVCLEWRRNFHPPGPRRTQFSGGAASTLGRQLDQIGTQLTKGFVYPSLLSLQPDGVTNTPRTIKFPAVLTVYLVPVERRFDETCNFFCRSILLSDSSDFKGFQKLRAEVGELGNLGFEAYHLIDPISTENALSVLVELDALSMQFQREWGGRQKQLESQIAQLDGISHDACHQLYDAIALIRWLEQHPERAATALPLLDGLLISMFGVPWQNRRILDPKMRHSWSRKAIDSTDALFWNIVFKGHASRILRASSLTKNAEISADYFFSSDLVDSSEPALLPNEGAEADMQFLLREGWRQSAPWPLNDGTPGSIRMEGEIALILNGFSELVRNAAAALTNTRSEVVDLQLTVELDARRKQLKGEVESRLHLSPKAFGVGARLMKMIPELTVKSAPKANAQEWVLDFSIGNS